MEWNKDKSTKFWSWYDTLYSTIGYTFCILYLIFTKELFMFIPIGIITIVTVINIWYWKKVVPGKYMRNRITP